MNLGNCFEGVARCYHHTCIPRMRVRCLSARDRNIFRSCYNVSNA